MKQLSMIDAFMLSVENEKQKLQMASVSILEPPAEGQQRVTRQVLRDLVAKRIHLPPALCRKLVHVPLHLDYPYWVDDAELDLALVGEDAMHQEDDQTGPVGGSKTGEDLVAALDQAAPGQGGRERRASDGGRRCQIEAQDTRPPALWHPARRSSDARANSCLSLAR